MRAHFFKFLAYIFMIGALFVPNGAQSQSHYRINWFTDSDGLPQNSVKNVFPDKYGYVWLSTENGLAQYDGQKFNLFNNGNISGINSDRMWFFEGNAKTDSLFAFNELQEVILINKRIAKKVDDFFYDPKQVKIRDPHHIAFGGIIPGYHFMAPHEYIRLNGHKWDYYLIGNDTVREVDKKNHVQSKYHYPIKVGSQFFLFKDQLYALEDHKDVFFLSRNGAIKKNLDTIGKDLTVYTNYMADQIFLYSRANKNLYLVEEIGDTIKTKLVLEGYDLISKMILSIYYDPANEILYLGSTTQGLGIIEKKYFKNILADPKSNDHVEYAMMAINDSTVLTASGAFIQNEDLIRKVDINKEGNKFIIVKDGNNDIWTKRGNFLYRLKKADGYKKYDVWKFDNRIVTLYLDGKQTLWIGTESLFSMDISGPEPVPFKHTDLDFNITYIFENQDNTFLIGGRNGLYAFDPIKKQKPEKIESIGGTNIRSIYRTGKDLWITTYNKGFILYNTERTVFFPLDQHKFLATAHCIVEDQNGFFWITTNKGLFQVSKQKLYDYAYGKIEMPYYHYYDKSSGFMTNEFNGGCYPCGVILPDNRIFVPSLHGIVTFNASEVRPTLPTGDIYFDEIEIDGSKQFLKGHFQLDRKFERITFFVSSPNFGHPYNDKIEIKLKGLDKQEWTLLNQERSISYTNLDPGKYTFTARKLSGFGSEYIYKTISFTIPPAFWQTQWFKVFLAGLLVMLVYFSVKIRTRYIRHKNVLLEKKIKEHTKQLKYTISSLRKTKNELSHQINNEKRLIRSITHDIKSPLKYLAIIGQSIYENPGSPEEVRENIKSMYTSSFQLYHFVDNILDYSKAFLRTDELPTKDFNLHNLVREKITLFYNIALSQHTVLVNNIPADVMLKLNKQLFSIILHNLLDNAVKNTFSGKIVFDSSVEGKKVVFSVKDTGSGMAPEVVDYYMTLKNNIDKNRADLMNSGLGLKMIIEILIIINGNIKIESQKDKGTKVSLIFDN